MGISVGKFDTAAPIIHKTLNKWPFAQAKQTTQVHANTITRISTSACKIGPKAYDAKLDGSRRSILYSSKKKKTTTKNTGNKNTVHSKLYTIDRIVIQTFFLFGTCD